MLSRILVYKFIDFAYRTFCWDNEASLKAHVHCVIVEFGNTHMPFMFNDEQFKQYLWEEHIKDVSITCYIIDSATKDYIGYCGIKNISLPKWEIAIELQKSQTGRGIGDLALGNCLNAVKERSDISEFCVRIDSDNYASQKLAELEKGAWAYGKSNISKSNSSNYRQEKGIIPA